MTPEAPITRGGSQLHDDSENDRQQVSSLEHDSVVASPSTEVGESDATSVNGNHRSWALDDIEGLVLEVVEDLAIGSVGQSIENVVNRRLFGCVAAWGSGIIQETLASAIAPTGDPCVDSSDNDILNNSRALLGRDRIALEPLEPPKSCLIDVTYQRRQIPIRAARRNHYDREALHHAVKAATRSHTHPASITSSRPTTKSKMRRKQHGAQTTHVEQTGPQPGVPYSTEVHDNKHPNSSSRHHIASPRKAIAKHQLVATEDHQTASHSGDAASPHFHSAGAGLQLDIDTDSVRPGDSVASAQARRSPPPLSKSPSSVASLRRPHPPGSAHSRQAAKTLCFGEREEEVKVEFTIQKALPRRGSVSIRGVLPDIDGGRMTLRPSLPYQAFGAFAGIRDEDSGAERETESHEDPLEQHFHAMPLSPGVKVRSGEEASAGPDLPFFASRMRRSTFVRMETYSLPKPQPTTVPNQHQVQQVGRGTFLTETAWDLGHSSAARDFTGDQVTGQGRNHYLAGDTWVGSKSDDFSYAETTASCSCGSSTSLTLFRKQSKVQRPCRSCSNPNSESTRADTMNFTSLVKQRAFHKKPPCLPTSSSPSKRAPGASPRRVTSAPPACSPLARRNLMLSKKAPPPHNRDLDSTTAIS